MCACNISNYEFSTLSTRRVVVDWFTDYKLLRTELSKIQSNDDVAYFVSNNRKTIKIFVCSINDS